MASVMGICGGLVGPESENVEKPLVFIGCFEKRSRKMKNASKFVSVT